MRTMVDVLPAKIPYLQRHRRGEYFRREGQGADLDAMGRWHRLVEALASQPPTNLCLADPAVAQDHELDVADGYVVPGEVREMCSEPIQAVVVVVVLRQDFDRHPRQACVMKDRPFQ